MCVPVQALLWENFQDGDFQDGSLQNGFERIQSWSVQNLILWTREYIKIFLGILDWNISLYIRLVQRLQKKPFPVDEKQTKQNKTNRTKNKTKTSRKI